MSDEENYFEGDGATLGKRAPRGGKGPALHEDGFDDRGVGDEKDQQYLAGLSAADREMVLHERLQKREENINKKNLLRNHNERAASMQKKQDELSLMKQERAKRKGVNSKEEEDYADYGKYTQNSDSDFEDDRQAIAAGRLPVKKTKVGTSKPLPSAGTQVHGEDELQPEDLNKELRKFDIDKLSKIVLSRKFLVNLASQIYFKEAVKGCLVRVQFVNPNSTDKKDYRIAEIIDVIEKPESYQAENKELNKYLIVKLNGEDKHFKIQFVSNQKITGEEIDAYVKELQAQRQRVPTLGMIERKYRELLNFQKSKATAEDIERIVEMRNEQRMKGTEVNPREKIRILQQRLSKLENTHFEKASLDTKNKIKDIKREIKKLKGQLADKDNAEDCPFIVAKSNPYAFGSHLPKSGDSLIHTRTIPKLLNMWTLPPDELQQRLKETKKQAALATQKEYKSDPSQVEKGLYQHNEDTKREFLESFQRDLSIDALIDALQVDVSVL